MGEEGAKFFKTVGTIIVVLIIVSVGVYLFLTSMGILKGVDQDIAGTQKTLTDAKYSQFDAQVVSGSQVVNAIRMYSDKITITVKTSGGASVAYNKTTKYTLTDPTNANYINPTGEFDSALTYDTNKAINGITFTQK